jgi:hypothetical protein
MKISKALSAVAASAMILGLAIPASAAGLMNVTTSGTTSLSGTICSHTTSWDEYAGAQLTVSETSSEAGAIGANLTGVDAKNALGGNLNLYGQKSQNFAAQANLTFFKGGDTSDVTIHGHINQMQTTFSTGVQTSFGN